MTNISQLKLSIITVCYNDKNGLIKTIKSVKEQAFKDYEYIIVDGGSTDGSYEVIRQNLDHVSSWVSEKDKGIYNAMNKGIGMSSGKFFLFLNSGDILSSNNILRTVFSQSHDEDIIYGNLIRKKGNKKYRITKYPEKLTLYHFYNQVPSLHHQASFIKSQLFDTLGLYREDFKIAADWEFFFRAIILNNCTIKHINENITIFDSFGISSGGNNSDQELKMNILKSHFPQRVLDDYKGTTFLKRNHWNHFRFLLTKNQKLFILLRRLWLPIIGLKEYINFLRVKE